MIFLRYQDNTDEVTERKGGFEKLIGSLRNPASPEFSIVNDDLTRAWQALQQELDATQRQKQLSFRKGLGGLFSKTKADGSSHKWRVDRNEGQPLGIQEISAGCRVLLEV